MNILVVGAGPAGIMAAIHAQGKNNQVSLIEANDRLGKKLLLTGNGRCNIANNKAAYKLIKLIHNGKFLSQTFANYDIEYLRNFYLNKGLEFIEESDNKLYPKSQKANDVLLVLKAYLADLKINIRYNSILNNIIVNDGKITKVYINDQVEEFDHIIFAGGGLSFPNLGSNGSLHQILIDNSLDYIQTYPVEAPLYSHDEIIKNQALLGIAFKDLEIKLFHDDNRKIIDFAIGDLLFTHKGLSGPGALLLCQSAYMLLKANKAPYLSICFLNSIKQADLAIIIDNSQESIRNTLYKHLKKRLVNYLLEAANIDPLKAAKQLSNADKEKIYQTIYRMRINIQAVAPLKQAFVTGGGIDLKEIDPKTFVSKKISNLSVCGEMLDLHGPIGGYNLLIAQLTGIMAGANLSKKKD